MRSKVPGISRLPGRTLADLAVQARAVIPHVWATGTYGKNGAPDADENINKEAMRSLIEDCCAAAGVDWRGATVGETSASEPVDADCADQRDPLGDLLAGLDLSAVPMRTLSALHDHVEALINICYGLAAQPRSLHDGRTLNEAGVVLDRLAEGLLQGASDACMREAKQRGAASDDDRDIRVAILARQTVAARERRGPRSRGARERGAGRDGRVSSDPASDPPVGWLGQCRCGGRGGATQHGGGAAMLEVGEGRSVEPR